MRQHLLLPILLLTTLLSACGWHLRGITPLPAEFQVLYLNSAASVSFNQQLVLQLEFNQVVLTEQAEDAQAVLTIYPLDVEKRTLALTSSGQIAEYELNALLQVSVQRHDSALEQHIELRSRRHLRNDINNVVGTANAEKTLRMELERDLVNKLMLRLQRLDYHPADAATE